MSPRFLALVAACSTLLAAPVTEPGIPAGWRLAAEEHFDTADSLKRWETADGSAWRFTADATSRSLELVSQSKYEPPVRSPFNLAVLSGQRYGDVIVEADLQQTGKEYPHRDMVVAFGIRDATHFYYVHLASAADEHAHNIFLVNGTPRANIAKKTTAGIRWGQDAWHRVRVERLVSAGTIRVFFDDMTVPIMEAEDRTLGEGSVGFGSFDDTGKIDNVRIWSPNEPSPAPRIYAGSAGK